MIICHPNPAQSSSNEYYCAAGAKATESWRRSTPKSGKSPSFYGVARGFKPGVYESWEEASAYVKNYSGHRVKKFKSRSEAEQFVQEARRQFFACQGGSEDGVYNTLKEVLVAVKKGGGSFEVFETEAEAAEFCKPPDAAPKEKVVEDMYVVWSGKSTGVMNARECVVATAGVTGAEADGPMSVEEAEALWFKKEKTTAPVHKVSLDILTRMESYMSTSDLTPQFHLKYHMIQTGALERSNVTNDS